jgi:hypothetical protein
MRCKHEAKMRAGRFGVRWLAWLGAVALAGGLLAGCRGSDATTATGNSGAKPNTPGQLDNDQQKVLDMEQRGGAAATGQPAARPGGPK